MGILIFFLSCLAVVMLLILNTILGLSFLVEDDSAITNFVRADNGLLLITIGLPVAGIVAVTSYLCCIRSRGHY